MLWCPPAPSAWRESIVQPIRYGIAPPFTELADLVRRAAAERGDRAWQDELDDTVNAVAGLTAVDGATV